MNRILCIVVALSLWSCGGQAQEDRTPSTDFGSLVERLSEPGGYFDTDNLISNERSYLHVVHSLEAYDVSGGAYIGVGPDQNFSYISKVRPAVAYIIDIRRDNMVMHLMFKALFEIAPTRIEYLSLLFGRPPPGAPAAWVSRPIEALADYVAATASTGASLERARSVVDSAVRTFGVSLSDGDWSNLNRFHRTFIREGVALRFVTHGRSPRYYYPTYRDLLLERDVDGREENFLVSSDRYLFLRSLQQQDLIIPVVGDLAGPHALRAIGEAIRTVGHRVSAFYTSNVEFYLFRDGIFNRFASNVRSLPIDESSVIIRSVFRGPYGGHPKAVPGYYSTQVLGRIDDLVGAWQRDEIRGYGALVMHYLPD